MDTPRQTPDPTVQDDCVQGVTALFPDICLTYLDTIAAPLSHDTGAVVNHIIDLIENGTTYPRRPRVQILKRKRDDDDEGEEDDYEEDEELADARRKYFNANREQDALCRIQVTMVYVPNPPFALLHVHSRTFGGKVAHPGVICIPSRQLITGDFPLIRSRSVQKLLAQNGKALVPTYLALAELVRQGDRAAEPLETKRSPTVQGWFYRPENIDKTIEDCANPYLKDLLKKLRAARLIRMSEDLKWSRNIRMEVNERKEYEAAEARGELVECECCFADFPKSRLVECDADSCHRFCFACARRNAETLVGDSKYEMKCMSTDGCDAGFSHAQRVKFLDKKLVSALDRIEQEAVLRLAAIENLASCPFCPYAAEYPSVEVNREFQCENPSCQLISCRLCQLESHVPKTCHEAAMERGVSARRDVEEAMTAAMIRKCNKCNPLPLSDDEPNRNTPFIKESGCNKMRCTRRGCGNTQCYVCSKSCDYAHFNDPARGGQEGNCPLFDVTENRHLEEVKNAEAEALKRVAEKNPDVNPELLVIKMSDKVKEDDEKRRQNDPFVNQGALFINGRRIPEVENAQPRRPNFIPLEEFRQLQLQPNDHENIQLPDGVLVNANALEDRPAAVNAAAEGRAGHVPDDPGEWAQLGNNMQQNMQQAVGQAQQVHLHQMRQRMIAQQRMAQIQAAQIQVAQQAVAQQAAARQVAAQQAAAQQVAAQQVAAQQAVQPGQVRQPGRNGQMRPLAQQEIQRQRDLEQRQNNDQRRMRRAAKRRPEVQQQEQRQERMPQQAGQERQRGQLTEQQAQRMHQLQQLQLQQLQRYEQAVRQQQQYELLRQQHQLVQQRQQEHIRQLQAGIVIPGPNNVMVGIPGGADQGKQPEAAQGPPNNFQQGWLERLRAMDVGFGPMQGMDFGRAFSNGGGVIGQVPSEVPGPNHRRDAQRNRHQDQE
ncbi:hypothetical protein QQX98_004606 [Neonectria punicea]|uniref:RING-type domain-containing protein n=1 Tax=Neonectria punicea TaxID=979145 RepID=A0ABR1H8G8_9HYPO